MSSNSEILKEIKTAIQQEIPDAKIYLFGSRVNGDVHEESDWDILIITNNKLHQERKGKIKDNLYQVTLKTGAFFDLVVTNKEEWENTGKYYSLRQVINNNIIRL